MLTTCGMGWRYAHAPFEFIDGEVLTLGCLPVHTSRRAAGCFQATVVPFWAWKIQWKFEVLRLPVPADDAGILNFNRQYTPPITENHCASGGHVVDLNER